MEKFEDNPAALSFYNCLRKKDNLFLDLLRIYQNISAALF